MASGFVCIPRDTTKVHGLEWKLRTKQGSAWVLGAPQGASVFGNPGCCAERQALCDLRPGRECARMDGRSDSSLCYREHDPRGGGFFLRMLVVTVSELCLDW